MNAKPTPQQPAASTPSPASPATTLYSMQGVPTQIGPTFDSDSGSTASLESHPTPQNHPQPLQAAHLTSILPPEVGDKSVNEHLAGGALPPPSPPKHRRRKRRDNKLGFRVDDDLLTLITDHRAISGDTESDAIRHLILAGLGVPLVIISPKTPPNHLEAFLGVVLDWQKNLLGIRSRLNAPLPRNSEDLELMELVRKWREQSKALLEKTPAILESIEAEARLLASLTPGKIQKLRASYPLLKEWRDAREQKIADPALEKEKTVNERWRDRWQILIDLLLDLGIQPEAQK